MSLSRSLYFGLGMLMLGLTGCGTAVQAGPEEELVSVSGLVTMDDQPVSGALVNFIPTGSNAKAHPGSAITDSEGRFDMLNYQNKDGLPAGSYLVVLSWWVLPDGSPPPPDVPPATSGAIQAIPPLWRDAGKAGAHNTVHVPDTGKTDFEFKLKKS